MSKKIPQDWPNLNRFLTENKSIPFDANRIAFIGDSIIEGWTILFPEFFIEKPYLNRGIGGQTSPQVLLRFRSDAINLQPKKVVLLVGTNDIAGNTGPSSIEMIMDNIISMAELAKMNGIEFILCSVLPAIDFYWNPGTNPAETIVELNKLLQIYAKKQNIPYIDFHTPMKDSKLGLRKEYGEDGVHPNREGYKLMSQILGEKL